MGVHDNAIGLDSMEGIDYVRAVSDEVGGNYGSMHDPMFYVHDPNVSIMRLPYYIYNFPFQEDVHIVCFLLTINSSFECLGTRRPMLFSGLY